ncbi:unnamed protein product [Mytilus coruscus]|uniref:Ig-like domain-containing protein n=1 Tax=Mytilus coruscus TaxID=42192 RepID=A0A6J8CEH8_MYTCO|nr:unnamed protein product [Mytilus coruscus]
MEFYCSYQSNEDKGHLQWCCDVVTTSYDGHKLRHKLRCANVVWMVVSTCLGVHKITLYQHGTELIPISKKDPTEGKQLLITCDGQSNPAVTDNDVTWTKQNNSTFSMKGKQFVISNVNRLDSGTYVCYVVIKLIPSVGQPIDVTSRTTVEVDVLYRPTVTITPNYTQFTVIENKTNLQLDCIMADANPHVGTFRWYKNGNIIDGFTDASYTISTVWRTHTGSYTCDATNTVGSSGPSSAVQLDVLYGIELYSISKNNQTEGKTLTITCSGQSYPLMTSSDVKWFKQNNNTFSSEGLQLVIENVNRLDSGTYVCSVVIQLAPTVGQPVDVTGSTAVEVEVLFKPSLDKTRPNSPSHISATENNTLVITVTIISNPTPTIEWAFKGQAVMNSCNFSTILSNTTTNGFRTSSSISIDNVQSSNFGEYTLTARNTIPSRQKTSL